MCGLSNVRPALVHQPLHFLVLDLDEVDLIDLCSALRLKATYLFAKLLDTEVQLVLLRSSVSQIAFKKSRFPGQSACRCSVVASVIPEA